VGVGERPSLSSLLLHASTSFLGTLAPYLGCLSGGVNPSLDEALESRGLTYDSLCYEEPAEVQPSTAEYRTLEDFETPADTVPAVSFFSGSGGLDIGFEVAGFEHVAAFEVTEVFCDTLRSNWSPSIVFGPPDWTGDLRNRDETESILRERLGISAPFEGVFHGGPPCQPFSIAANQRFSQWGDNFKRVGFAHEDYGGLLFDYVHYIAALQPRAFLLENVPGLATMDGGEQLRESLGTLVEAGYSIVGPSLINMADYGVPQERTRLIVMGWRGDGRILLPAPQLERVPCYRALEKPVGNLTSHVTRKHKAASILRYSTLRVGQRDHLGRVDRLDPNAPSKAIIAGGTRGGGRSHLHPLIPRTMSVRESARLQTFPDSYVFRGANARQFTQVGNAVPPLFAFKLASAMRNGLYSSHPSVKRASSLA
jgi:DNA (cytosine-5)-methyltransferase 1